MLFPAIYVSALHIIYTSFPLLTHVSFEKAHILVNSQRHWRSLVIHHFKALRNAAQTAATKESWRVASEETKEQRRQAHKSKLGKKGAEMCWGLCDVHV